MIGQGAILGNAEAELRAFLDRSGMPAASTLLGLSALPSRRPPQRGNARDARQLRPQHQKQGVRPARRRRNAFRRPRNGRPRRLRPQRPDHPFGDRPLRNRQDRPCRRAPRGRRQAHAPAADRTHPPARPQRMDRGVPRLRPHRVRACGAAGDPSRRRAHPHGRGGRRRGTRLRPRRGDGHRRGAAADVRRPLLRVPPQPQRRHVGRSGNHGVRPPGRHRRQAGRSRTARSSSSRATAGCK